MAPTISRDISFAEIIYRWVCAHCAAVVHTETRRLIPGQSLWMPTTPPGWHKIGDAWFCPKHKVVHLVDGEPL
jgi:rubredoxin